LLLYYSRGVYFIPCTFALIFIEFVKYNICFLVYPIRKLSTVCQQIGNKIDRNYDKLVSTDKLVLLAGCYAAHDLIIIDDRNCVDICRLQIPALFLPSNHNLKIWFLSACWKLCYISASILLTALYISY